MGLAVPGRQLHAGDRRRGDGRPRLGAGRRVHRDVPDGQPPSGRRLPGDDGLRQPVDRVGAGLHVALRLRADGRRHARRLLRQHGGVRGPDRGQRVVADARGERDHRLVGRRPGLRRSARSGHRARARLRPVRQPGRPLRLRPDPGPVRPGRGRIERHPAAPRQLHRRLHDGLPELRRRRARWLRPRRHRRSLHRAGHRGLLRLGAGRARRHAQQPLPGRRRPLRGGGHDLGPLRHRGQRRAPRAPRRRYLRLRRRGGPRGHRHRLRHGHHAVRLLRRLQPHGAVVRLGGGRQLVPLQHCRRHDRRGDLRAVTGAAVRTSHRPRPRSGGADPLWGRVRAGERQIRPCSRR